LAVQVVDETEDLAAETPQAPAARPFTPRQSGKKVDYSKASGLMERCKTDARNNTARLDRDRQDWENSLFYRGGACQWWIYDRHTNTYVPRGDDPSQGGLPDWVPRPVTNIFGNTIDQIAAILDQSEPAKLFGPSTDDDEDRATAEVAEDADPVLLEEIGYDTDRARLNKLICLTNGAAYIVSYDNDPKYGMDQIDLIRCGTCGVEMLPMELEDNGNVCPGYEGEECGAPGEAFEPVIGPDGVPQGVPFAKGKMCGQLVPCFEYSLPSNARVADSKANPWVLTHSGMKREDIVGRWPKAKQVVGRGSGNANAAAVVPEPGERADGRRRDRRHVEAGRSGRLHPPARPDRRRRVLLPRRAPVRHGRGPHRREGAAARHRRRGPGDQERPDPELRARARHRVRQAAGG
jgi:hypothetical protein